MTMNAMAADAEHINKPVFGRRLLAGFLAFLLVFSLFPANALAPIEAYAADSATSGTYGGCEWELTRETSELVIRPAAGNETGTLPTPTTKNPFPWRDESMRRMIVSVVVEPGVKAGSQLTGMFANLDLLESVDLSGLDFSNAGFMNDMFSFPQDYVYEGVKAESQLHTIIFGDSSPNNLQSVKNMFSGCASLKKIDLSGWDFSGVTNFSNMFNGCSSLTEIGLPSSLMSNANNMSGMFRGCGQIRDLRLDYLDTANVTDFSNMFNGCTNLFSVFVSSYFTVSAGANTAGMFDGCSYLRGGFGSDAEWFKNFPEHDPACIDSVSMPGLFTAADQHSFYDPVDLENPAWNGPPIDVQLSGDEFYYDGSPVEPEVTVRRGYYELQPGVDYTLSYADNRGAGTGTVTITGQTGNLFQYTGSITREFTIKVLTADDVTIGVEPAVPYTGAPVKPAITVKSGTEEYKELGEGEEGTGYRVSYLQDGNTVAAPIEVGTYEVVITVFTPNGSIEVAGNSFQITRQSLEGAQVYIDYSSMVFTGGALQPGVDVIANDGKLLDETCYSVTYANNVNPGTATVTVTGRGGYSGTAQATFIITGPLSKATFRLSANSFTYDGTAKAPGVTVSMGGKVLRQNIDYTLGYRSNVNAGTAYAVVVGRGLYTGTVNVGFIINKANLTAAKLSGLVSKAYNKGRAISQVPTVKLGALTLKNKTHFTVSYKNNKKLGTAKVTVTGKGNFTGSKTGSFKIVKYKQPMTAKASSKTAKYSTVKKKASTIKKCITVKKAQGKVTYANASTTTALKKFKVNSKNGAITVPKGAKKGTYKVKVKVETKGTSKYAYGSKTVTVSIKVK